MSVFESLYAAGMVAVRRLSPTVSGRASKLGRGVDGRRTALESLERWAEAHRDPARPLLWVHAPSVGEGLQARAVIETVFEQFERRGTLNAVLRYLVEHDLRLTYRLPGGVRKGEIDSELCSSCTLLSDQ